eukprot:5097712-Ditylum_brightwellii.AAC.1
MGNFLHALVVKIPAIIMPILDGEKHHHSKRDSTRRVAEQEKKRIDAIVARCHVMALSSEINDGNGTDEDKRKLEDLNKKAAKLQKELPTLIPPNFMEELDDKLTKILAYKESEEGGFVCKPQMAMLQADSVLTYHCIHNKPDVICSKDTDFVVLAGQ